MIWLMMKRILNLVYLTMEKRIDQILLNPTLLNIKGGISKRKKVVKRAYTWPKFWVFSQHALDESSTAYNNEMYWKDFTHMQRNGCSQLCLNNKETADEINDIQCARIHGWKRSHNRLVNFVDQCLHILIRRQKQVNKISINCCCFTKIISPDILTCIHTRCTIRSHNLQVQSQQDKHVDIKSADNVRNLKIHGNSYLISTTRYLNNF